MQVSEPDFSKTYSYADYLLWTVAERFEIIKGKVFTMSPAPNTAHQRIVGALYFQVAQYLKGKTCEVFVAPFDVRLSRKKKDTEITTVVQPDICVVCDSDKIDEKGCLGAPDLVVEILSPGNNKKELKHKFEVYEESRVQEYWIIHPEEQTLMVYTLVGEKYQPGKLLTNGDQVYSPLFPGFILDLNEIFPLTTDHR